ncbi:MAG: HDOD domain-containing protein [Chloroflexi bacterium]|nr:HDOD domain-containing protein [Chloroflexota bacterium]
MERINLDQIVSKVNTLPTIALVYDRVCEMVENPDVSAADLGKAIAEDQTLTARLLRIVNSAFYGFPEKITTVTRAISILGFEPLKNLVLATSVMKFFDSDGSNCLGARLANLWSHSLACAVSARALAKRIEHLNPEEMFVAGLLHDIGKVVLLQTFPEETKCIFSLVKVKGIPFLEAEHEVIGVDHPQIGSILSKQWKLPPRLGESIALHHSPNMAQSDAQQTAAVHLADILARALQFGSGGDDSIPTLNRSAWDALHLPMTRLEPTMIEIEREYFRSLSLLRPSY